MISICNQSCPKLFQWSVLFSPIYSLNLFISWFNHQDTFLQSYHILLSSFIIRIFCCSIHCFLQISWYSASSYISSVVLYSFYRLYSFQVLLIFSHSKHFFHILDFFIFLLHQIIQRYLKNYIFIFLDVLGYVFSSFRTSKSLYLTMNLISSCLYVMNFTEYLIRTFSFPLGTNLPFKSLLSRVIALYLKVLRKPI